jgi:hypothetical protein
MSVSSELPVDTLVWVTGCWTWYTVISNFQERFGEDGSLTWQTHHHRAVCESIRRARYFRPAPKHHPSGQRNALPDRADHKERS